MLGIYKMHWDAGRMGSLHSIFVAEDTAMQGLIGQELYFGECLGKHSEVYGTLEESEITLVTQDPSFVKQFVELDCSTGKNPFQYVRVYEDDE